MKEFTKEKLEELYEDNFDSLFRYIRFKVNTSEIAEDICAEAFTRAFESLAKFKGNSTFKTYVYTIAKNLLVDHYRGKDEVEPIKDVDNIVDNQVDNSKEKETKDEKDLSEIRSILLSLKEKEREVLELRYLSKFSVRETAEALELSTSNVKVLTHRALEKCRKLVLN